MLPVPKTFIFNRKKKKIMINTVRPTEKKGNSQRRIVAFFLIAYSPIHFFPTSTSIRSITFLIQSFTIQRQGLTFVFFFLIHLYFVSYLLFIHKSKLFFFHFRLWFLISFVFPFFFSLFFPSFHRHL